MSQSHGSFLHTPHENEAALQLHVDAGERPTQRRGSMTSAASPAQREKSKSSGVGRDCWSSQVLVGSRGIRTSEEL